MRLQLEANGYYAVPCTGKRPTLNEWQKRRKHSREEIEGWNGANTGIVLGETGGGDLDILMAEAAECCEEYLRRELGEDGEILVRIGLPPKRAVLFRTDKPFAKIQQLYHDPAGNTHKIEFLCDGQQIVVQGTHPDTGGPYTWHGGRSPLTVRNADLPLVTKGRARDLLEGLSTILSEEFGFARVDASRKTNGTGEQHVDVEADLAAMKYQGGNASINETLKRVVPGMFWKGYHPNEILARVSAETAACGSRAGQAWDARQN
jgi:Bifunctional DNA primase/polymerase, N-terminal